MDTNNLESLQISELESLNKLLDKNNNIEKKTSQISTSKKVITMTLVVIISIILLLLINFTLDVYQSFTSIATTSIVLAWAYIFVYCIALLGIITYIVFSIKSYTNLKDSFEIQEKTLNSKTYEVEKELSISILNHYKEHPNKETQDRAKVLYSQVNSNSVHSPFIEIKKEIINSLDKEATSTVFKSAKEVSLFTAFSPGSALDSIVVIFSSMKLMKKIFHIYGYKTNLFTSLLIIRKILENASIAALVEYTDDSVNDLLGNTIISKLSIKVAQGVGNGVLMLRIGNMLMQSARPFASDGSIGSYKYMVKIFIQYIKEKAGKKK